MCAYIEVGLKCKILILIATKLTNTILDYASMFSCAGGYVASDSRVE